MGHALTPVQENLFKSWIKAYVGIPTYRPAPPRNRRMIMLVTRACCAERP